MAYSPPTIDVSGLVVPSYNDILEYLVDATKRIFGDDVYLDSDSQDYQLLSAFALMTYDVCQCLILDYNSHNPTTATGVSLDRVASYVGITRTEGSASSCMVTVTGTPGTVISYGSVGDENGYLWQLEKEFTIPSAGSIDVLATCTLDGPIQAPIGTINQIKTPTLGWTSVTNKYPATLGLEVEADSRLRERIRYSASLSATSVMDSIISNLYLIDNVLDVKGFENYTSTYDDLNLPPHSIAMVVEGGDSTAIAQCIYDHKTPGTATYGTTDVVIKTESGREIEISFSRPTYSVVTVVVNVVSLDTYTDNVKQAIIDNVINAFRQFEIGQSIYSSSLYIEVLAANPDAYNPAFYINNITLNGSTGLEGSPFKLYTTDATKVTVNATAATAVSE